MDMKRKSKTRASQSVFEILLLCKQTFARPIKGKLKIIIEAQLVGFSVLRPFFLLTDKRLLVIVFFSFDHTQTPVIFLIKSFSLLLLFLWVIFLFNFLLLMDFHLDRDLRHRNIFN